MIPELEKLQQVYTIKKRGDIFEAIKEFHTLEEMKLFYFLDDELQMNAAHYAFHQGEPVIMVISFLVTPEPEFLVKRVFAYTEKQGRKNKFYNRSSIPLSRWAAQMQLYKDAGIPIKNQWYDWEEKHQEVVAAALPKEWYNHKLISELTYYPFLMTNTPSIYRSVVAEYKHPGETKGYALHVTSAGKFEFGYTGQVFDRFQDAVDYLEKALRKNRLKMVFK